MGGKWTDFHGSELAHDGGGQTTTSFWVQLLPSLLPSLAPTARWGSWLRCRSVEGNTTTTTTTTTRRSSTRLSQQSCWMAPLADLPPPPPSSASHASTQPDASSDGIDRPAHPPTHHHPYTYVLAGLIALTD